ncbi:hypothetical protein ACL02U_04435 [Streptomyces sp. MS06]|uniref:hypothetical protein n=1 Tax=Streptomyces sp. MS06 TaxID=3385974 RepID=UPI0039A10931
MPRPEEYGYGPAAAKALHGRVIAYRPREENGRVVVPVTIENQGTKRTAYEVTVRVERGRTDRSATARVEAGNVFPRTTWPTQVDVSDIGASHLEDVTVAVSATVEEVRGQVP